MLMMHGRGGCTVRTLVGVHIDNQFSSFLPLQGKINLSRERLRVAVQSPPPQPSTTVFKYCTFHFLF